MNDEIRKAVNKLLKENNINNEETSENLRTSNSNSALERKLNKILNEDLDPEEVMEDTDEDLFAIDEEEKDTTNPLSDISDDEKMTDPSRKEEPEEKEITTETLNKNMSTISNKLTNLVSDAELKVSSGMNVEKAKEINKKFIEEVSGISTNVITLVKDFNIFVGENFGLDSDEESEEKSEIDLETGGD